MTNPSSDSRQGTGTSPSRRQFFHAAGLTAGGLYALAGPSLAGPWIGEAEAAEAKQRAFVAGRFGLEIDNAFCGAISGFEGGNNTADVFVERLATDRFPRKHLGNPKVEPITIEVGLEMSKPWYEWVSKTLNLENARRNGAIIEMDLSFKEVGRRTFTNAFISEIEFPSFRADTKTPANMNVTITADQLKLEGGSGKQIPNAAGKQRALLASNYRLSIQGLEQATQRASKIEAFGFKQGIAPQQVGQSRVTQYAPGLADFTNLAITVPESFAGPLYAWLDDFVVKGNNNSSKERPGILEILAPDMKPVASVQLSGLGVIKVSTDTSGGNVEKTRMTKAEMYCQRFTITFAA